MTVILSSYGWISLILITFMSSIMHKYLGATSLTMGIMISIGFIYLFTIFNQYKIIFSKKDIKFFSVLLIIIILSTISMLFNLNFNIERYIGSLVVLIFFFIGVKIFSNYFLEMKNDALLINIIFYILILDGVFSTLENLFIKYDKSFILFTEPSLYALIILPLSLYKIIKTSTVNSLGILTLLLLIAFLIQNLTLLVGIILIAIIKFKIYKVFFIFLLTLLLLLEVYDLSYFLDRIDFSSENRNLSTLVYLSGWERAIINSKETIGVGIGFQQLGYVGTYGEYYELLKDLGYANLNLYDGGTLGSKLISELGFFGIFLIGLYLIYFFKFFYLLKKGFFYDEKHMFLLSIFVMFSIELFIRGVGYFTPTSFLFIVSLITLFDKKNKLLKINETEI